jgi:two-component system response regulator NreC
MTPDLHVVPPPADPRSTEKASSAIRVIVADDHELMRFALRALLSTEQQIDVIAEAEQLSLAMRNVRELRPDVLVLDLRMHDGSSIDAIGELREQAPETRVVVITAEDNPLYAEHALAAGAFGFVLKDQADVELAPAVRAAAEGRRYVSPEIDAKLADLRRGLTSDKLTGRELEVLRLIALGHTSVEVARILQISSRTVESHRARVHAKLGLSTRAELVRYALRRGLLGTEKGRHA